MVNRVRRYSVALVFVALILWLAPASAQVATGNVAGTIKDDQGGVIPGATVTLAISSSST
jgi:hypothetical protein